MGSASRGTEPINTRTVLNGVLLFYRGIAAFSRANSYGIINRGDKYLAVADLAGKSGLLYGLDNFLGIAVFDYHFNPCLGH